MNYGKPLLILLAGVLVFVGVRGAKANSGSHPQATYSKQLPQSISQNNSPNLTTSRGTLKKGSVITVDPDQVIGIPKTEAGRRFILNKIYRVQEGTTADDLFIVDEKANKWAVENVSDATEGATTPSLCWCQVRAKFGL